MMFFDRNSNIYHDEIVHNEDGDIGKVSGFVGFCCVSLCGPHKFLIYKGQLQLRNTPETCFFRSAVAGSVEGFLEAGLGQCFPGGRVVQVFFSLRGHLQGQD